MERLELSQELGRDILAMAKAQGASQGDVVMVESDCFLLRYAWGKWRKSVRLRKTPGASLVSRL